MRFGDGLRHNSYRHHPLPVVKNPREIGVFRQLRFEAGRALLVQHVNSSSSVYIQSTIRNLYTKDLYTDQIYI